MKGGKDDDVGYCKPPKASQFKPGQSGNPKGRPKGVIKSDKSLFQELMLELDSEIAVTHGGKVTKVTKIKAIVKTIVKMAITGHWRAIKFIDDKTKGFDLVALGLKPAPFRMTSTAIELFEKFKGEMEEEARQRDDQDGWPP